MRFSGVRRARGARVGAASERDRREARASGSPPVRRGGRTGRAGPGRAGVMDGP